ncbi:hypothetical protein [Lutibacter maritimus]|uniref:Uncharacterized protein n=1 Tax=Lutibacter maritimus TaxID=593133 RepID=A0A1I6S138_9FLAO|nr:hypothetical protein [Lutibacter maritimus]SFS70652.1 hypothetical protein SAMN04488006_2721 [Lutibacter maritimus]
MFKNNKYFLFILTLLLLNTEIYSQSEQEYLGVIKLNDSSFISYRLNLLENNNLISGYSITDIGGDHETKSNIRGTYDNKTNILSFKEIGIVYTKSEISDYDFCYIHFKGKVNSVDSNKNIEGKFNGLYNDGSTCINGEIKLRNIQKIEKRAEKIDKLIQKSKQVDKTIKSTISVAQTLDSLKMNILKPNQNLTMFSNSSKLELKIYDAGKVDGDKINVYVNDTIFLRNYVVSKKIKQLTIPLKSKLTSIKVEALNIGTISPNTAKIEIIDQENNINTLTHLKKGEKTSITIVKNN